MNLKSKQLSALRNYRLCELRKIEKKLDRLLVELNERERVLAEALARFKSFLDGIV